VPCAGKNTSQTGFYPKPLADVIVEHVKQQDSNTSNTCVVQVNAQCTHVNSTATSHCPECYERTYSCVCNSSSVDVTQPKLSQVEELVVSQVTRQVNKVINRAKAKLSNNKPVTATLVVATSNIVNDNMTENMLLSVQVQQAHREKLNTAPLNFMSSVVKVLKRNDPLWSSPEAKAALMKESNKLISAGVWEVIAEEKDDVTRKYPDVTYSRLFDFLGLKSSEMNNPVYKARIVVQGSNVTDSSGDYVFFLILVLPPPICVLYVV
jgi:hypothetical protein